MAKHPGRLASITRGRYSSRCCSSPRCRIAPPKRPKCTPHFTSSERSAWPSISNAEMPPPRFPWPPYFSGKRIVVSPSSASIFIHFMTSSRYSSRSMSPGTGLKRSSPIRLRTRSRISRYSPSSRRRRSAASTGLASGAAMVSDIESPSSPCASNLPGGCLRHARTCQNGVPVQHAELRRRLLAEQSAPVSQGHEHLLAEGGDAERGAEWHPPGRREPDGADRARPVTQVRYDVETAEVGQHRGVNDHVSRQRDQLLEPLLDAGRERRRELEEVHDQARDAVLLDPPRPVGGSRDRGGHVALLVLGQVHGHVRRVVGEHVEPPLLRAQVHWHHQGNPAAVAVVLLVPLTDRRAERAHHHVVHGGAVPLERLRRLGLLRGQADQLERIWRRAVGAAILGDARL